MTTDRLASPTPPTPAGPPRSQRIRNLLMIVAGFVVTLGVVVGGALYFLYERSVGIDRSTPEIVTDQFLGAVLRDKDVARTSLFVCSEWSPEAALAEASVTTNPQTSVSWEDMIATVSGEMATVSVRVILRIPVEGGAHRRSEVWTVRLSNEDGWRVCGLSKESSLDP